MSQLQAKANHSRICQLLIGKGGNAFRSVLQTKVNRSPPPSTLDSFLKANKIFLRNLRVVTPTQWNLLFPASGLPDSKDFDITLLTILLRNICGLPSPAAGWKVMPPASDTSISAEILRIKMFRNEVYAHLPCPEIEDAEFERLWQEVSKPLIKLGIPQKEIDDLKEAPLTSEEESYIQELKKWKEFEDELISKLNDLGEEFGIVKKKTTNIENKVDFVEEKVNDLSDSISHVENEVAKSRTQNVKSSGIEKLAKFEFKGKIEELRKKFQEGTRKWFFDGFKNWLDDENSRVMILTAGPGVGKSVLSAKICELYQGSGQLAACHLCDFRTSDYKDPHRILQSLASQMCDNVNGFRERLTEALSREHSRDSLSDAFRVLLHDPLHALDRREPMLIVIDALDESKTTKKSEFLELISSEFSRLPKWIRIFITSRPELQVRKKLKHLNPFEILPNDEQHEYDIRHFIECCLPNDSMPNVESFVDKCQGSFLYAYHLVSQAKQSGIDPNADEYVSQDISGFYEKQFERLRTELQCHEQDTKVSIFKAFVNVVAALEAPLLPFKIIFMCMGLSNGEFKIREAIISVMSEILPVFNDCLTVFHKSVWDWLRLDGYEEHAYAADVADGKKRLWCACKKLYSDINSLSSVSDFSISLEKMYALRYGRIYLMDFDDTEDLMWLVNVKVNYLNFQYYDWRSVQAYMSDILIYILHKFKRNISRDLYWQLFQLYVFFSTLCPDIRGIENERICSTYLQCFANKQFGFVNNAPSSRKDARAILNETKTIWLEEVTKEIDYNCEIISNAFLKHDLRCDVISASQDNKLLAIKQGKQVEVYQLPGLTILFQLEVCDCTSITFSPDSSYLLLNSLQTCVSIKNQNEASFISHGPAEIHGCSFSSCGTKLVTLEKKSIQVWDVSKKELLQKSESEINQFQLISFSSCDSHIFLFDTSNCQFKVFDSITLKSLEIKKTSTCLTAYDNCTQFISPRQRSSDIWRDRANPFSAYFQLPTGENILCIRKQFSKPFTWKGRKCVMTLTSLWTLGIYDYIKQEFVNTFKISSLLEYDSIDYILNVGEKNFLIGLDDHFLLVLSLESSSERVFYCPALVSDDHYPVCYALSLDNLYVACSYHFFGVDIINVDNGKVLQTVAPKQNVIGCWWTKLYFWVVCKGLVVLKYPYNSTESQIVGNYEDKYSIDIPGYILKLAQGVLVTQQDEKISFSKISDKNLFTQQISDSRFNSEVSSPSVVISSDGFAVLLYDTYQVSCYELWEMRNKDKWELLSSGTLDRLTLYGCLTGRPNFRRLLWISRTSYISNKSSELSFIDFPSATKVALHELPIDLKYGRVVYAESDILVCHAEGIVHFIHVSHGKVITSIYVGHSNDYIFIPSKCLLLLYSGRQLVTRFKVHNLDKYLLL